MFVLSLANIAVTKPSATRRSLFFIVLAASGLLGNDLATCSHNEEFLASPPSSSKKGGKASLASASGAQWFVKYQFATPGGMSAVSNLLSEE